MSAGVRDLQGRVALVTGASRGIGRAIALKLAARGAFVAAHYNASLDAARELVAQIESAGGAAVALAADLGQADAPRRLFEAFDAELHERGLPAQLHILVNNAGVGKRATIEDVSEADFDHILQVDLKSPFFIIQQALPRLQDGGRIINVSSMGTRAAYPVMAAYAPAKAGLEALTLLLAEHLGPRGITVNAVLPGATATDMNPGARNPESAARLAQTIALRRVGQPEDIADIVAFLASDAARWVTAQRIDASGGQRL
jgi:NAD(P)-dependent dehydrogenase (short-subunit alcohol dehydrogenase family)